MKPAPRNHGVRRYLSVLREPGVTKYAPLAGLGLGALAAVIYWLGVQLWPSSVALILSMLSAALLNDDMRRDAAASGIDTSIQVFYVLLKFNVLMALSAAKLPFDAPPSTALCLIMICVCLLASRIPRGTALPGGPAVSHLDLGVALLLGFSPALLLGMPGLIGLAAAIASIIGLSAAPRGLTRFAPWVAETCFYLGAQASWSYV